MSVPVTVLSGTLGAGKTTTLKHVLTADHGYEVAVLVNDMGEVNVDAAQIQRRVDGDRDVVELSNGCICCGMQSEFEQAITELALEESFEYLLVEPSGISEPGLIVRQFLDSHVGTFYELSSVTTVVDARQFYDTFRTGDVSRSERHNDERRPLSDLIIEGIEFCDTIVLNKTDLVSETEVDDVIELIRTVQPEATLYETTYGRIDPERVLDPGRFDLETVSNAASWKRAVEHDRKHREDGQTHHGEKHSDAHAHSDGHAVDSHDEYEHLHPPERYGIDSFVYRRRGPMHPERLADALRDLPDSVVRVKGYLHIAGRSEYAFTVSKAGRQTQIEAAGRWIASLPKAQRERYREIHQPDWNDEYGDRKTELVVIGREIDRDELGRRLDECLLSDAEGSVEHDVIENPFPNQNGATVQL